MKSLTKKLDLHTQLLATDFHGEVMIFLFEGRRMPYIQTLA